MQFMLLIYHQESTWKSLSDESRTAIYKDYRDLSEKLFRSGTMKAGGEFDPTSSAVTVRVREGKAETHPGPFEPTREQLAGFFLVEAKDVTEAIAIAVQIPSARDGSIEVRSLRP